MAHTAEPSVSIYPCVKGTVVQVLDCIATVRVEEVAGTRDIQFTNECLFKDGEVVLDDFSEVLHEGDEVHLNYMVGSRDRKDDVVHCDLVWLGRPPDNAECMGPDEFAKSLGIKASSVGVRATADDLCSSRRSQQEDTVPKSVSGKHAGFAVSHQTVPPKQGHFMENLTLQETLEAGADEAASVPSFERHPEQLLEEPQVVRTKSGLANAAYCVSPGLSDETLLRLARMVVQEFRAEFREEVQKCVESLMKQSRIVVRDVESQTNADDLRMSSTGESTPPFFSPCSTPTRELDVSGASPPVPELASHQLKFSDTRPADAVVVEPLELQRVPCADNTTAHTSCEQDDNNTSQPSVQVQSGNVVDMAKTSDEACNIKPPDEPEGTVASQPLELQKVTPADDTATDTSCELCDTSSSQPPEPLRTESMAGVVRSYSDETADVNSTISQPFEALVTHDNHVEELAVHIGTVVLELSDKSCTVSELSNLSETADEASLSSAESHNVLPQNGSSGTLLTEKKELSLSGEPEEAPISQPANENEAQPSNAQNDSVDGIVSQAGPDELDTAPTDTFVWRSTENKVSVVIETPDPVGSSILHQTAEDKVPEVSDTCDTALVDATVLQQTAEIEVSDVFEAPDNAIVDATPSQQAAEKIPGVLETPGEALVDVTGLQRTAEDEAPNLLEMLDSASALVSKPTETVIPMAANDSSSQPAAALHVLIENDSTLPPVLPGTVSAPDASSAELTQEYDAQVNMNSTDALKASDISESML